MRYVIIVAVLLATIFTFNSFTLTYLLTGGGPGGATRIYTILAYEYAVAGLRYGSGIAVAMTMAPFLFVLILFLGRYMMQRTDAGTQSRSDEGIVWRAAMVLLWPVRMLVRGLLAVFWAVNDAGRDGPRRRRRGRSVRPARRRCCRARPARASATAILYVLLGAVLLFELLPFYFIFMTAFKTKLQIQQIQNMFWPAPWTLDNFRYMLFEKPFLAVVRQHHHRGGSSAPPSRCSRRPGRLRAGAAEVARRRPDGHDRADRLPDAAGPDVHPAVLHPGAARGSRTR